MRAQASKLNRAEPSDALPPKYKSTADMRAAAEEGDNHMAEGVPAKQHIVIAASNLLNNLQDVVIDTYTCP